MSFRESGFRRAGALSFFAAALLVGSEASAAQPELLGKFGVWSAYSINEGKHQVCYMSAVSPAPKKGKVKRGDALMMVTHRPFENSKDVFSYSAGLPLKPAREATLTIGPKKFSLFTQGDTAWARDVATDRKIAEHIRAGNEAAIYALSSKGQKILEKISLSGSSAAYTAMSKACGVEVRDISKKKPAPAKASAKPEKPKISASKTKTNKKRR